jgi:hypothetical protein
MSTFILALIQILKDLKYFAIVFLVIIFMFGEMMHIAITSANNGAFCTEHEGKLSTPGQDFCSPNLYPSYFRVYSMLLGDFNLEHYRETQGMEILFVIFTLIGMIIMLNVLIAIVSDSYQKSSIGSGLLFAMSRVSFVAQHEALEAFLRPGAIPIRHMAYYANPRNLFKIFVTLFRWAILFSFIFTALSTERFLFQSVVRQMREMDFKDMESIMMFLLGFVLAFILTFAIWILILETFEPVLRACAPKFVIRRLDSSTGGTAYLVKQFTTFIFGLNDDDTFSGKVEKNENDNWSDRLEKSFERAISKTKEDLTSELQDLEKRLLEKQKTLAESSTYGRL